MTEQHVPITEEEFIRRNKLLRWKKRGIRLALFILMIADSAVIYLLQQYEKVDGENLYIVAGIMTLILLGGLLLYRRFARLINLDMQSHEKIVTIGVVVRTNFIGNRIYPTRLDRPGNQKYLTLDVNGRWITLSGIQIKRLLPEVWQLNHVALRDRFIMEYTPYGRHLMRLEKR
jgi:hypothetical protein